MVSNNQEKTEKNEIRICAGGITAISKACTVAEILRHRIIGLSLIIKITNNEAADVYEPREEGLNTVTIKIKLTTEKLDMQNVLGYHPPLDEKDVREFDAPRKAGEEPCKITIINNLAYFLLYFLFFSDFRQKIG